MCGICGWVDWNGSVEIGAVEKMVDALVHRGPDSSGSWLDPSGTACFGHRRLAVIDPSPESGQPFRSARGDVLVFNGEIYDFSSVRKELEEEGFSFRTRGDTEVLLAALLHWGEGAFSRLCGQFALAFWNPDRKRLILARDRMGIKPLFWAKVGSVGLVFASEIPALLTHPGISRRTDPASIESWLQLGYLSGRKTLLKQVFSLPPGSYLEAEDGRVEIRRWYDPLDAVGSREAPTTREEAAEELGFLIRSAVGKRLVADVPLGCFLSGGVDSTMVVSAAAAIGARPETLSVCFQEGEDETADAERTAVFLGLENRKISCDSEGLIRDLDRWALMTGDPLADPSFLPTELISRQARTRWKVALTGDGGDELLSGYPRLRAMPRLEALLKLSPAMRFLPAGVFPARRWGTKLGAALRARSPLEAYQVLQGLLTAAEARSLLGRKEISPPWPEDITDRVSGLDSWTRWRALDLLTFLPGRMLSKTDRASMAVGLELRLPLLDHCVVEFLLSLPVSFCKGKELFRIILHRHGLPQPSRRKRGFEIPLSVWLRGPLRGSMEARLLSDLPSKWDWNSALIRSLWEEHLSGKRDHGEKLVGLAILLAWLEEFAR